MTTSTAKKPTKPPAARTRQSRAAVAGSTRAFDPWTPLGLGNWVKAAPPPPPAKGAAKPGDVFPAEATVTAQDAPNAAKLAGLGYVAVPTAAWSPTDKITIGTFSFRWTGTAWAAAA